MQYFSFHKYIFPYFERFINRLIHIKQFLLTVLMDINMKFKESFKYSLNYVARRNNVPSPAKDPFPQSLQILRKEFLVLTYYREDL